MWSSFEAIPRFECVQKAFKVVSAEKGITKALNILCPDAWKAKLEERKVPDWQIFLLKLDIKISDHGWQKLTNLTHLWRTKVSKLLA